MAGPPTSEIGRDVDRLVIAVHRAVMTHHRPQLQDMVEMIGVTSPGHFYDLAEFLAVGACTVEIAKRRFRYEPDNAAEALISELHDRRLVDDNLHPSEPLVQVIANILLWRAEAAANLWRTDLTTALCGAAEALPHASGPVAEAFRSLPEPTTAAHRLHPLLPGLRYARLDAHVAAWEEAGLSVTEIVALSAAVTSAPVSPTPESLVARGWLTAQGSATAEGRAARSTIETQTNSRCDALFDAITDRQQWLAAMGSLAPQDE